MDKTEKKVAKSLAKGKVVKSRNVCGYPQRVIADLGSVFWMLTRLVDYMGRYEQADECLQGAARS